MQEIPFMSNDSPAECSKQISLMSDCSSIIFSSLAQSVFLQVKTTGISSFASSEIKLKVALASAGFISSITIRGEKLFEYSDLQIPVYLWLLSEKPELLVGKLDYFKEQLLPLINLFI